MNIDSGMDKNDQFSIDFNNTRNTHRGVVSISGGYIMWFLDGKIRLRATINRAINNSDIGYFYAEAVPIIYGELVKRGLKETYGLK